MSTSITSDLPLVSIVIPAYNAANFLANAIESALQQTYPHVEIIVVNDGSGDDGATTLVARSYGSRIRYFEKENGGCGSALNYGIERMNGEYFSWLSHDDLYDANKIDLQIRYALLRADNPDFGAVCCAYRLWHMESGVKEPQKTFSAAEFNRCKFYGIFRGAMNGNAMLIHRRVFDNIGLFDSSLRTTQDYEFFYRMLKRYDVVYHDDILVTARVHPRQDTNARNALNIIESDRLWSIFIDESKSEGIEKFEPSPLLYWLKFANHLALAPYPFTREKVFAKLATQFEHHVVQTPRKVSIILAFLRVDGDVLMAAKSAFLQTYPDAEFILSANAPASDEDIERINRLARILRRDFRLVHADATPGLSYARNRALDAATGDLVAFIEPGDVWHPIKIERQVAFFDVDPNLEVCSTGWLDDKIDPLSLVSIEQLYRNRDEFINVERTAFPLSTIMFKETDHRFDETLSACEELMFFGGLMSAGRFGYLPYRLTAIRRTKPLTSDFERDIESRSLVVRAFAADGQVNQALLDDIRFSYIKIALARLGSSDLKFLFNQRGQISRRIRERRHGFRNVVKYGLRRVMERMKSN